MDNVKALILDRIKANDKIIIFRHKRPDGDCVGASIGLRDILRLTYPQKTVKLISCDYADYTAFLGEEDGDVTDEFYKDALAIVVDTATTDRISNPKFALCKSIIKIDHHIEVDPYGDLRWVEEERCATSEMIAEFYSTFKNELKIDAKAATAIYTGMVTDSGRFRFRSVSGETLRLAAMLLDMGIDTETLYANLYMREFNTYKFQSHVYENMQITKGGVSYILVDLATKQKFGLTNEQASTCVSYMENIKDSLIWLAFIENGDGTLRVRLRSRFVTVNAIAEQYGGGGHACAAGATLQSRAQMDELVEKADKILTEYKNNNTGWL